MMKQKHIQEIIENNPESIFNNLNTYYHGVDANFMKVKSILQNGIMSKMAGG